MLVDRRFYKVKLSVPVYQLKRQARLLSREAQIPLHEALDRVATQEGFASWSLLAAKLSLTSPALKLYESIRPGELVLVAARPGQGKTLFSLEVAVEAMKAGHRSVFFTLEYTEREGHERFQAIGADLSLFEDKFEFDGSDNICAEHIIRRLASADRGTVAVVDYLQLLDQKRTNPGLAAQIQDLKSFAQERGLVFIFISQVDRAYDPAKKPCPDLADIRLPNPLDLYLFDKTCFLNNGEIQVKFQT